MMLEPQDFHLYFRLHRTLMHFVNQRLKVIPENPATPDAFSRLPTNDRLKVRDALTKNLGLIDAFVAENPAGLPEDELEIVLSWRHMVGGRFHILRDLTKHAVFLSSTEPFIAYGVSALMQPFHELIGTRRPIWVETVLFPFKGKIVYESILVSFNITFGPGVRRSLNDSLKEAKERWGIVTSLPMSSEPPPAKASKAAPKPSREEKDESLRIVVELIDAFCKTHLNEEYAVLCRKMAETLSRKRPSPLLRGKPNAWAAGIVRAVGGVNFLDDKSQTPHMRSADVDHHLGTSATGGATKATAIRKMLDLHPLDPNWTLPSQLDSNPLAWIVDINGFALDVRLAPREVQEIAFNKGLIPYIPADRLQGE